MSDPKPPLRPEPGWTGLFTRGQVDGAIPNGAAIVKVAIEDGDAHPVGTRGTVLGSLRHPEVANNELLYFVEWAHVPRIAVAIMGWKIGPAP